MQIIKPVAGKSWITKRASRKGADTLAGATAKTIWLVSIHAGIIRLHVEILNEYPATSLFGRRDLIIWPEDSCMSAVAGALLELAMNLVVRRVSAAEPELVLLDRGYLEGQLGSCYILTLRCCLSNSSPSCVDLWDIRCPTHQILP